MKIAIDARKINDAAKTGVEYYVTHITRAIVRADILNKYVLFTEQPLSGEWQQYSNVTNEVIHSRILWSQTGLLPKLRKGKFDLLFVPGSIAPIIHPKMVATVHDLGFYEYPQNYSKKELMFLWFSHQFIAKRAKKIIAVSKFTKDELMKRFHLPKDRIKVIHHGVELPEADKQVDVKKRYGLGEKYFFFLSRLEQRKNIKRLVEAFDLLAKEDDEVQLVLGGRRGQISDKSLKAAFPKRVKFVGYVPEGDVASLYKNSLAFVFPSLYEGFGMPILEAFKMETPVITSRGGAMEEVAGDAAMLVDPHEVKSIYEAMKKILSNKKLRMKLRKKGNKRLKDFSWKMAGDKIVDIFNSLGEITS